MMSANAAEIVLRGCCHVYCALDIGYLVDLDRCTSLLQEAHEESDVQRHAPAPAYLNLRPPPVRISRVIEPLRGTAYQTEDRVTITIYDFGAVSVEYRVPFEGTFEHMAALSSELYDTQQFAADARRRAESLLAAISSAVRRVKLRAEAEDYLVFEVYFPGDSRRNLAEIVRGHRSVLAQILSSNTKVLSRQQQREELRRRIAYYNDDLTIITWNAAILFGTQMEDVLTVLELANVQLCELRYLDDQLDNSLQESYDVPRIPRASRRRCSISGS